MSTRKQSTRRSQSRERLRARAEVLLRDTPERFTEAPAGEVAKLVQELRVYQTELEMQNEDLLRIQHDLEESRARLALLYDQAPIGYLTLDARGVVQEANLTVARMLGLERQGLLRQRLSRFIAAESRDELYLHLQQVFRARTRQTCELRLLPTGAETAFGHFDTVAMPIEPGQAPHCLSAVGDVTRRHEAEASLQASQSWLDGIVRLAIDAIILVDSRQQIVLFNEAAQRMFGRTSDQVIGRPLDILIPAGYRKAYDGLVGALGEWGVARGPMSNRGPMWGLRADGTEFPVEASISQMEANGQRFFTVILRDLTARLERETALRRNEAVLTDFFSEAPLGLVWVAPDGCILRVNRALLELLGRSDDEVLGHGLAEFHIDPEISTEMLRRLARKETIKNRRARIRARSGTPIHVLIDANGLWEEGRLVHTRWFVRDVTWRVQLEREILKIGEYEQQRLGQELHDDLCQHLSSIEFLAHSLAMDLSMKSADDARRVLDIARLLRETNARTRDLSHGLSPMPLPTEGLAGALEELARRTCTVFRRDCHFHCPTAIQIDDTEVEQHLYRIAQEAVGNAINHGKATRIEIGLTRNGSRLMLGIRDNGLGLSRNARRKKGMGLRIMQYRAGVISGSLVVQREPGGGTAVVCSIPESLLKSKRRKNS